MSALSTTHRRRFPNSKAASQSERGRGVNFVETFVPVGKKYELEIVGGCEDNVLFNERGMCRLRIFLTI